MTSDSLICQDNLSRKFSFTGASAAAMLIFILPSAFYIKLVKKEPMKSVQKIGVSEIPWLPETVIF